METTSVKESADTVVEPNDSTSPKKLLPRAVIVIIALSVVGVVIALAATRIFSKPATPPAVVETAPAADPDSVTLAASQMQNIKLAPAALQPFRAEKMATGKIAFNEEMLTPVFSPYTGRVTRLLARPGDPIKQGAPLFEIDTPDLVQAETDLITASIALAKSHAALELARRAEDRQHRLYLNKAVALKDWEQAEADMKSAERDLHAAETALAGARSRLRVFGKTDAEIARIESDRQVDRITRVLSPIAGTITARKVGPGQYVKPDSPDPLFTVANLSTVWILADVYESDVPLLKVGQPVEAHIAAYPNEVFTARIAYIAPAVDPTTHRVAVRGVIENRGQRLKPDMFASLRIATTSESRALAVPVSALVRDGEKTRVWVNPEDNRCVRREVMVGIQQGDYVQIISGLQPGEKVVVEGSLFLTNAANMQD